jgi:hypothetical protein
MDEEREKKKISRSNKMRVLLSTIDCLKSPERKHNEEHRQFVPCPTYEA